MVDSLDRTPPELDMMVEKLPPELLARHRLLYGEGVDGRGGEELTEEEPER